MDDNRPDEIITRFPLRKIRLDMCICGHDDSDHQTEMDFTRVSDGACSICVCKKFELEMNK